MIYTENNRPELAQNELDEAAVLEEYLPKQLSTEELEKRFRQSSPRPVPPHPKRWEKLWVSRQNVLPDAPKDA